MPPTAAELESPYETEARYGAKRGMSWIGYKVHLTETCEDELPHLLIAQGIRACGLRQARYRGLAEVHLQHVATAAAMNVACLTTWLNGIPRAATRRSHFAALAPAS